MQDPAPADTAGTLSEFEIRHGDARFRVPVPSDADHIVKRMRRKSRFYEADLLSYLAGVVGGAGLVVDCGANVGNHTLFFSGVMGRRVLSIEPVQRNRQMLERLLALNGLNDRVRIAPVAVSDTEAEAVMVSPKAGNPGMFRLNQTGSAGEAVQVTTVDALLAGSSEPVALIKFDLEGFEAPALRGAMQTVRRWLPVLSAELTTSAEFAAFFEQLSGLGYAATQVFCATPTVVFEPGHPDGQVADAVRKTLLGQDQRPPAAGARR